MYLLPLGLIIGIVFSLAMVTSAFAQSSASQRFRVAIPSSSFVTPPVDTEISAEVVEGNQLFAPQIWEIEGNSTSGLVVDFAVEYAFRHVNDPTMKNNASMQVSVLSTNGPANWSLVHASDATDVSQEDEAAYVQVTSDGVGAATVQLDVQFVYDPLVMLAEGSYELVVISSIGSP